MKYWLFVFVILCFHLALLLHNVFWLLSFVFSSIFLAIKYQVYSHWLIVYIITFLLLFFGMRLFFQSNQSYYLVIDHRHDWALIHNGVNAFYMQVNPSLDTHWGDLLRIEGSFIPIRMTTYEGLFNFPLYLEQRGVYEAIEIDDIQIWMRFPFRFDELITQRLNLLEPKVGSFVSQLFWKRTLENNRIDENLYEMIQYSGFGFYLSNRWLDAILKLKFSEKHSRALRLIFLFPYLLMNLRQYGMVRVYFIELLTFMHPKQKSPFFKVIVISIQSWFNPYIWLQSGTHLYLLYQLWMTFFMGLFPNLKTWKRWMGFVWIGLIYGWFREGIIFNLSSIWFLPLTWGHSLLFPFWVTYLYSGLSIPGLNYLTNLWINLINLFIGLNTDFYGGEISSWMQMMMIMILIFIGISIWLHLKVYQPKLTIVLMILMLGQISGLENLISTSVYFINVGQGDSTLIQSFGKTMLIDTGGVKSFDMAQKVLIPFFKKLNIRSLDYLIITHPDFDHDGGMPSLLASFRVKNIVKDPFESIQLGHLTIQNYQQFHSLLIEDNERSLVIGIHSLGCQWLIMGDATDKTESLIQRFYPTLKATILRIGHHGSNSSTSIEFLKQIQPKEVVISVGGGNRYGHPHPDVLERIDSLNIPIRRTDIEGTIRYQTCKI